jgi:hypothetical protein
MADEGELIAEYGSVGNVRFLDPENVRMYDTEGNVVLCGCGKPAAISVIGLKAQISWCTDCSPVPKTSAQFVYRPTN